MNDLVEGGVDLGEGPVAQHVGHLSESGDFEERLNFILRVAMGRVTDAETIVGDRGIAMLVDGVGEVGVFVVVDGDIPVALKRLVSW